MRAKILQSGFILLIASVLVHGAGAGPTAAYAPGDPRGLHAKPQVDAARSRLASGDVHTTKGYTEAKTRCDTAKTKTTRPPVIFHIKHHGDIMVEDGYSALSCAAVYAVGFGVSTIERTNAARTAARYLLAWARTNTGYVHQNYATPGTTHLHAHKLTAAGVDMISAIELLRPYAWTAGEARTSSNG